MTSIPPHTPAHVFKRMEVADRLNAALTPVISTLLPPPTPETKAERAKRLKRARDKRNREKKKLAALTAKLSTPGFSPTGRATSEPEFQHLD